MMLPRILARCGLTILGSVLVLGCAGAMDDLTNVLGKQRKFLQDCREAQAAGRFYDAAVSGIEALKIKADYADAQICLRSVASQAYRERFLAAEASEKGSPATALRNYEELKSFSDSLARHGATVKVADYDTKFRELNARIRDMKEADALKAFDEAEALFERAQYDSAIAAYRRAVEFVPGYRNARERIAEGHYRLATSDLEGRRYRRAAEHFMQASSDGPYKDSMARAAAIHASLGSHFLRAGFPRNALADFGAAQRLAPNRPDVTAGIEVARRDAVRRIAIVGISNRTGQNIGGMSVEDFIGDEIFAQLQQRKSEFIEVYTRTNLSDVIGELKFSLNDLVDKDATAELGKLKGVHYVVAGKITQVSHRQTDPTPTRHTTSYQEAVYQEGQECDKRKCWPVTRHVGNRTQHVQYDEIGWRAEVVFAGSISLFEVATGKILTSKNFTQREAKGGRWAQNLSVPAAKDKLSTEVKQLFGAPQTVESSDTMAKRLIDAMASELVGSILAEIDRTPTASEPGQLDIEPARLPTTTSSGQVSTVAVAGTADGGATGATGTTTTVSDQKGMPPAVDRVAAHVGNKRTEGQVRMASKTMVEAPSREQVRKAQQALKNKGHDPGPVDGVMGAKTETALRQFQKKEGLVETGQLDPETARKLGVE